MGGKLHVSTAFPSGTKTRYPLWWAPGPVWFTAVDGIWMPPRTMTPTGSQTPTALVLGSAVIVIEINSRRYWLKHDSSRCIWIVSCMSQLQHRLCYAQDTSSEAPTLLHYEIPPSEALIPLCPVKYTYVHLFSPFKCRYFCGCQRRYKLTLELEPQAPDLLIFLKERDYENGYVMFCLVQKEDNAVNVQIVLCVTTRNCSAL